MFNTAVTLQNTSFAKSLRLAGKETQLVPESFSDQSVYFCVRQIMKECEQQCKMLDDCRTSHTISELANLRDGLFDSILTRNETIELLNTLCLQ